MLTANLNFKKKYLVSKCAYSPIAPTQAKRFNYVNPFTPKKRKTDVQMC